LIAEPLFRVKYAEKVGTGTTDMIADCRDAGLPEPDFEQRGPHFVVTLWRDWLTAEVIATLNLNDRQQRALIHLKTAGRIGNTEYQTLLGVAKRTAHRDLTELVERGILEKVGTTGRGTAYVLRKGVIKGPKGPSVSSGAKGATKGPKGS
jgi:predicted HTH transcriptional regulator